MRQSQRAVTDIFDIAEILKKSETIRIGINGPEYPYVVPVSFGFELLDGKITIYFHGAKEGLKHDLIAQNNHVCVESDFFKGYHQIGEMITAEYESVIGFGIVEIAEGEDAIHGLELLLSHANYSEYAAKACVAAGITRVYKVVLSSVTGKRRLVH